MAERREMFTGKHEAVAYVSKTKVKIVGKEPSNKSRKSAKSRKAAAAEEAAPAEDAAAEE